MSGKAGGVISVIVPSWRRAESLARGLRALAVQTRPADEIIVGLRDGDDASARVVASCPPDWRVRSATTASPGVIAAMSAALAAVRADSTIVALTDDDTEPRTDWLARLEACFADPRVGGAGGRDWQPHERGDRATVGVVQWFGRVIGNHHLGAGAARDVDVLKGANCAFRAPLLRAIGFDSRLAGAGAQLFWELGVCLPLRRAGWRLVYDPAIAVEHHVEPRNDADQLHRGVFSAAPLADAAHNETLALLEYQRGLGRVAFRTWASLVGTRHEPGLLQVPRLLITGDAYAVRRWRATRDGRARGVATWKSAGMHSSSRRIPGPPV